MMSIQNKSNSGKDSGSDKKNDISFDSIGEGREYHTTILLLLLFLLSGFSAFALGRLSMQNKDNQQSLVVETIAPRFLQTNSEEGGLSASTQEKTSDSADGSPFLVGSKNSDKYHFPWCSGAKRIKAENLVLFSSYEEAREAGYTPAGNCDGLQ
ncbi:MAG: Ada metal-binding domain-containing protein [Candidatus Paceibacterota bacterium]